MKNKGEKMSIITIQNAIARAIEMNILEDLAPQLVQERQFISRHYDEKLGLLLYEVYHKKKTEKKKNGCPFWIILTRNWKQMLYVRETS